MAASNPLQSALDEVQARLYDAYGPDAEMTRRERAIAEAMLRVTLKLIADQAAEKKPIRAFHVP
jgi:hypothetical protein